MIEVLFTYRPDTPELLPRAGLKDSDIEPVPDTMRGCSNAREPCSDDGDPGPPEFLADRRWIWGDQLRNDDLPYLEQP